MKAHRRRVEKAIHDKQVIENLPKTINETRAKVIQIAVEAAGRIEFVGSTAEEYIHEPIEAGFNLAEAAGGGAAAQDVKKQIFEEIEEEIIRLPSRLKRAGRSDHCPFRDHSRHTRQSGSWRGSPRAWDSIKVSTRL